MIADDVIDTSVISAEKSVIVAPDLTLHWKGFCVINKGKPKEEEKKSVKTERYKKEEKEERQVEQKQNQEGGEKRERENNTRKNRENDPAKRKGKQKEATKKRETERKKRGRERLNKARDGQADEHTPRQKKNDARNANKSTVHVHIPHTY